MAVSLRRNQVIANGGAITTTTPVAGDLLICTVLYTNSGTNVEASTRSLSDNRSNVWTEGAHTYNNQGGGKAYGITQFFCLVAHASLPTITATISGTGTYAINDLMYLDFTGFNSGSAWLNKDGSSVATGTSNSLQSGSFSTASNGDVVVGGGICQTSVTLSAGTGFTKGNGTTFTVGATTYTIADVYNLNESPGSYNPTISSSGAVNWAAVGMGLASIAPGQPFMQMLLGVY